jgi:hypothetical protein
MEWRVKRYVIAGALVLATCVAQVSLSTAFSSISAGQGGRMFFSSNTFHFIRDTGTTLDYRGPLLALTPLPNSLTGWSWANQGSSTVTTTGGTFNITTNAASGNDNIVSLVKTAPATPYTVVAVVGFLGAENATGRPYKWDSFAGPSFRESSSGKVVTCQWENDGDGFFYSATYWSTPSSGSDVASQYIRPSKQGSYGMIRLRDDGTNRYCDVTMDAGAHWLNFYQETRTTNMTADQVGFSTNNLQNSAASPLQGILLSWSGA